MNLGSLLCWGRAILSVLERRPETVLRHSTATRLEEKFGWLRAYRKDLAVWSEYQMILEESVDQIRRHGYSRSATFQVALRVQRHVQSIAGRELKDELLTFITDGARILGNSVKLAKRS